MRSAPCKPPHPRQPGDDIHRKDELGAPGRIYGHGGQIHFEICCDEANLRQFVPRAPAWTDPLAPVAPSADGRTDSVFGSMYVYLPAGTPTSATPPSLHVRAATSVDAPALPQPQWVQITYDMGSAILGSHTPSGEPIGKRCHAKDFEYNLYAKANERHGSLDAATQALSSPSGWYELLRFGRNLGPDPLPAHAAHWREIPTATGTVWADLNAEGTFKFSDADFPAFKGWNCFDDDGSPTDQRCDSLHLKTLIRDPDPRNDRRMEPVQLARRLGEPTVRTKLRRAICRFPSEWDQSTIVERYSWLLTEDFKSTDDDATGAKKWERFVNHARAISFSNLPAEFLKADWRFHPRAFTVHMRQCGWLNGKELDVVLMAAPSDGKIRAQQLRIPMNLTLRKYMVSDTRLRHAHFLTQVGHETGWWQYRRELGTPDYWRTMYEVVTPAEAGADYDRAVQRGRTLPTGVSPEKIARSAYVSLRPAQIAAKAAGMNNGVANSSRGGSVGDGERFRGRGFLQITGRKNYKNYSQFRGQDFTSSDQRADLLASNNENACDASGFYWAREKIGYFADLGAADNQVTQVGSSVNRGSPNKIPDHDAERKNIFRILWQKLNDIE